MYRWNNCGPKTLPCGTPVLWLSSLLQHLSTKTYCGRLERNCVRTSNSHNAELEENLMMVDPVPAKSGTETDLNNLATFSISEVGGWKHTCAFHKPPKINRHQTLKYLGQYRS